MPNQDQTGPNGQGASTGTNQGRCQGFEQTGTDQDTSFLGSLRRRFRSGGQQAQGNGRGKGRARGGRSRGGCRR